MSFKRNVYLAMPHGPWAFSSLQSTKPLPPAVRARVLATGPLRKWGSRAFQMLLLVPQEERGQAGTSAQVVSPRGLCSEPPYLYLEGCVRSTEAGEEGVNVQGWGNTAVEPGREEHAWGGGLIQLRARPWGPLGRSEQGVRGPGPHDWGRRGQGDPVGQALGCLRSQGLGCTLWGWSPSFQFVAPAWRGSLLFLGPPPRRWGSSPRAVGGVKWQAVCEGASPLLGGVGTRTQLLPLWPWSVFFTEHDLPPQI